MVGSCTLKSVKIRHGTNRVAEKRKGSTGNKYKYMKPPESRPNELRMLEKKFVLPIIFPRLSRATKSVINAGYAVFATINATPKRRKLMEVITIFP